MIEIYPNLFIGSGNDLIHVDGGAGEVAAGWFVVTAAKDPWHRELLGYTGRGAPKDHAEYLFARRKRRLFCNLVDAADPAYIRDEILTAVIEDVDQALALEDKVLIHCNQGQSRAPMLGLHWLRHGNNPLKKMLAFLEFDQALEGFGEIYPDLEPADGMRLAIKQRWDAES